MSGLLVLLQDYFGPSIRKAEKLNLMWKSIPAMPAWSQSIREISVQHVFTNERRQNGSSVEQL